MSEYRMCISDWEDYSLVYNILIRVMLTGSYNALVFKVLSIFSCGKSCLMLSSSVHIVHTVHPRKICSTLIFTPKLNHQRMHNGKSRFID